MKPVVLHEVHMVKIKPKIFNVIYMGLDFTTVFGILGRVGSIHSGRGTAIYSQWRQGFREIIRNRLGDSV